MKARHSLLLMSLPLVAGVAAPGAKATDRPSGSGQHSNELTPGSILAAQVSEIASSKDLSNRSKKRQITTAVRLAALTATTNAKSPDEALKIVLELVKSAAQAAPEFAEIIPQAVQDISALAGATDVKGQLDGAVVAGIKAAASEGGVANFESEGSKHPRDPEFGGRTDDFVVSPSH